MVSSHSFLRHSRCPKIVSSICDIFSPFCFLPRNRAVHAFLTHSCYFCLLSTSSAPGGDHSESAWGARFDVPLTALYTPGDDA
jgi:hypothetical protein